MPTGLWFASATYLGLIGQLAVVASQRIDIANTGLCGIGAASWLLDKYEFVLGS